ncbi:unnamed protein product [Pseudo-nitzschia multistriata]|uniref:Uncharacterized protein n=1 Tax=Pseudo-nitzschia multistriata TaxID=183589 RepID=A0A448ZTH5_9STRA|nr:unnamed protein product [Pseudo-nitzschia multistriata]
MLVPPNRTEPPRTKPPRRRVASRRVGSDGWFHGATQRRVATSCYAPSHCGRESTAKTRPRNDSLRERNRRRDSDGPCRVSSPGRAPDLPTGPVQCRNDRTGSIDRSIPACSPNTASSRATHACIGRTGRRRTTESPGSPFCGTRWKSVRCLLRSVSDRRIKPLKNVNVF